MSYDHLADAAERMAERMTDSCRVTGPGSQTFDEATDSLVDVAGTLRYEGACTINMAAVPTKPGEFAGQQVQIDTFRLRLPVDALDVREGDTVEITDSRDPALVGATFDVADIRHSTFAVTRIIQLRRRQRTHPTV